MTDPVMAVLDKLLVDAEWEKDRRHDRLEAIALQRDSLVSEEARVRREIADYLAVILYCHREQLRILGHDMADALTAGAGALAAAVAEAKARLSEADGE